MNKNILLILVMVFSLQYCSTTPKLLESIRNHDRHTAFGLLDNDPSLISVRDQNGNSALHYAVSVSDDDLLIELIKRYPNINVNVQNNNGTSPVHIAAEKQNLNALRILLKSGANFELKTNMGSTPLLLAVFKNALPSIKFFNRDGKSESECDR